MRSHFPRCWITTMRAACLLTVSAALFVSNATAGGTFPPLTCDALPSGPITPNVNFINDVFPLLTDNCVGGCGFSACINCHGGPATPENRLVISGVADNTVLTLLDLNRDWILPLAPRQSRLYAHINCSATSGAIWRMPLVGNRMQLAQQALIYDWINQGARATFEGEPFSDVIFRDSLESIRR
jgi:hypothetical protein